MSAERTHSLPRKQQPAHSTHPRTLPSSRHTQQTQTLACPEVSEFTH
jgi:hypothetical protein